MNAVRTKHNRKITRLALVLALAVVASAALTGLAETLRVDDHGQDPQSIPPEVASHMHGVLGVRSLGDVFPHR
jgi:hypothetical protein